MKPSCPAVDQAREAKQLYYNIHNTLYDLKDLDEIWRDEKKSWFTFKEDFLQYWKEFQEEQNNTAKEIACRR